MSKAIQSMSDAFSKKSGLPDPLDIHERLKRDGFVKIQGLINANDVAVLRQQAAELLGKHSQPWDQFRRFADQGRWQSLLLAERGRTTNFFDFIGESAALDDVLDRLLSNQTIRLLLLRILGRDYGIWYCQIRRAETNSAPLRIHQDRPGELGMSILLSDVDSNRGTTVFIRGSHRWPRIINSFPFISPLRILSWTSGVQGTPGDVHFFYNDTWHGGTTAKQNPATAIILTFLPAQSYPRIRRAPESVVEEAGPALRAALTGTTAGIDEVPEGEMGPDVIIRGKRPHLSCYSLWHIPIALASVAVLMLLLYRRLRKSLSRTKI